MLSVERFPVSEHNYLEHYTFLQSSPGDIRETHVTHDLLHVFGA